MQIPSCFFSAPSFRPPSLPLLLFFSSPGRFSFSTTTNVPVPSRRSRRACFPFCYTYFPLSFSFSFFSFALAVLSCTARQASCRSSFPFIAKRRSSPGLLCAGARVGMQKFPEREREREREKERREKILKNHEWKWQRSAFILMPGRAAMSHHLPSDFASAAAFLLQRWIETQSRVFNYREKQIHLFSPCDLGAGSFRNRSRALSFQAWFSGGLFATLILFLPPVLPTFFPLFSISHSLSVLFLFPSSFFSFLQISSLNPPAVLRPVFPWISL